MSLEIIGGWLLFYVLVNSFLVIVFSHIKIPFLGIGKKLDKDSYKLLFTKPIITEEFKTQWELAYSVVGPIRPSLILNKIHKLKYSLIIFLAILLIPCFLHLIYINTYSDLDSEFNLNSINTYHLLLEKEKYPVKKSVYGIAAHTLRQMCIDDYERKLKESNEDLLEYFNLNKLEDDLLKELNNV